LVFTVEEAVADSWEIEKLEKITKKVKISR
jgi:hypothetical protein